MLHLHHIHDDSIGRIDAIERAICREQCALVGEPPCWEVCPDAWPNMECDEPGCRALACAAEAAVREREVGEESRP